MPEHPIDTTTKAMTVRLPSEQALALEKIAQIDDIPVAEAVRNAITTHIETRRGDEDFQRRIRELMERDRDILERLLD